MVILRRLPFGLMKKLADKTIKVPHKLSYVCSIQKDPSQRVVIGCLHPYDEYEVDIVFQFRSDCFDFHTSFGNR